MADRTHQADRDRPRRRRGNRRAAAALAIGGRRQRHRQDAGRRDVTAQDAEHMTQPRCQTGSRGFDLRLRRAEITQIFGKKSGTDDDEIGAYDNQDRPEKEEKNRRHGPRPARSLRGLIPQVLP
jgi:hypothetical protein